MIEHSLSALYDIPHGAGLSVIIPGWMKYSAREDPSKFVQLSENIFQMNKGNAEARALAGIKRLQSWFKKIHCPTALDEIDVPKSDIPRIAHNALELCRVWRMREYSQEIVEEIFFTFKQAEDDTT